MIVESTRFGPFETAEDQLLAFPDALPGFPSLRSVAVVNAAVTEPLAGVPGAEDLFWLQDVDDPATAFLVMSPWTVFPDYEVEGDFAAVGSDPDALVVMVILTVKDAAGALAVTANLRAPLVIDTTARLARQVILGDDRWPVRMPLAAQSTGAN